MLDLISTPSPRWGLICFRPHLFFFFFFFGAWSEFHLPLPGCENFPGPLCCGVFSTPLTLGRPPTPSPFSLCLGALVLVLWPRCPCTGQALFSVVSSKISAVRIFLAHFAVGCFQPPSLFGCPPTPSPFSLCSGAFQ